MSFDVSDLNNLAVDLGKASGKTVKRASKLVRKTALDVERDAKIFAPVDTGNLRGSISSDIRGLSAEIGPTANYGGFVEYGTSKMAPRAFVGPALDRHGHAFVSAMVELGGDIL